MKYIYIILISIICSQAIGQNISVGIPMYKNYKPTDFKQESQIFTAIKNPSNGIMYFCNSNGILQFDNSRWEIINTPHIPLIILKSAQELFYYANSEMGIINTDSFNIIKKSKIKNYNMAQLFKINEQILLTDKNNIYKLITKDDELCLDTVYNDSLEFSTFVINNLIFCYNQTYGFKAIDEKGNIQTNHILSNKYTNKKIIDVINNNNNSLLLKIEGEKGFHKIINDNTEIFYTDVDNYIESNEYSCMQITKNNDILVGTKQGGIVCIDNNGKFIYLLNQKLGLCNNFIQSISIDDENNIIWLCTNNGISLLNTDTNINISIFNYIIDVNSHLSSLFLHPVAILIYFFIIIAIVVLIIFSIIQSHIKEKLYLAEQVELKTKEISAQKEKVEKMMKNWLPARILKTSGDLKNRYYNSATVIFGDISGFSKIITNSNAENVLGQLNEIFQKFDHIIKKYDITKIKTIGDAYMCAGGIEVEDNTHVIKAILTTMEMQRYLEARNQINGLKLEMRFGIHSGPLVSGIVGKDKLEYDIWGDTVNIANRMESSGTVNRINVSSDTYYLANNFFDFEDRGKIDVKFLGEKNMYFVTKIKNNLTDDGITPNYNFNIKLQLLTYKILETKNIIKLQEGLPANLYYHNSKHTTDVIYWVEDLGKKENVSDEEMLLLKCAALFHDMGFLIGNEGHEDESVKIASKQLKTYNFSDKQINTICRLILATKQPINPKDLLEKIICDADLNYLTRPDFIPISKNLFRELNEIGKIKSEEQWNKQQYDFIKNHCYFTETAKKWNVQKEILLSSLIH